MFVLGLQTSTIRISLERQSLQARKKSRILAASDFSADLLLSFVLNYKVDCFIKIYITNELQNLQSTFNRDAS